MYEFHVVGLIGPVVQAALPELTTQIPVRHSVLTGTAGDAAVVDRLIDRLTDQGIVADHIVIARETRWQDSLPAPTDGS